MVRPNRPVNEDVMPAYKMFTMAHNYVRGPSGLDSNGNCKMQKKGDGKGGIKNRVRARIECCLGVRGDKAEW